MITVEMLKDKRACSGQIELFEKLFPNGVEVTEEICVQHALDFDWYWCSQKLLSLAGLRKYNGLAREARAEFIAISDEAWMNFVPEPNEYNRTEYLRILSQERDNLEKALAKAFAKAYLTSD